MTRVTVANPFREHPLRRYAFAWDALAERTGRHLDVGCGNGEFVGVLSATTGLDCYGADPHPDYLVELRHRSSVVGVQRVSVRGPLAFRSAAFASASLLDDRRRFVDLSDELRGDMSVGRTEHTNYRSTELVALVEEAGFRVTAQSGANLFWRFFQVYGLLAGGRLRALLNRMILADGRRFSSANLFLLARRIP